MVVGGHTGGTWAADGLRTDVHWWKCGRCRPGGRSLLTLMSGASRGEQTVSKGLQARVLHASVIAREAGFRIAIGRIVPRKPWAHIARRPIVPRKPDAHIARRRIASCGCNAHQRWRRAWALRVRWRGRVVPNRVLHLEGGGRASAHASQQPERGVLSPRR